MNKYQEALDIISGHLENEYDGEQLDFRPQYRIFIKSLQELVDRATPKKVENYCQWDEGEEYGNCPNCHTHVDRFTDAENNFCPHCGQSLEWEEGEKK